MLHVAPASSAAYGLLVLSFILVLAFEAANGFHDTANAVATVIYTNSLKPRLAVLWSGAMNFLGVLVGGIAVAYALVDLLPADVLSPPDGTPAVSMLLALFVTALGWNVLTWWFGIPNSSSHCVIGALIGIAVANALANGHGIGTGVDWDQVWKVLRALAISPVLGLVGAGLLYFVMRHVIKDRHLYEPPEGDRPPHWGVRALLLLTCTSVSFSHGTNDGQKSIGLIMLTVIGLLPAAYALNPDARATLENLPTLARDAVPLIEHHGGDDRQLALDAAHRLADADPQRLAEASAPTLSVVGAAAQAGEHATGGQAADPPGASSQREPGASRSAIRTDVYRLITALQTVARRKDTQGADRATATRIAHQLAPAVEYAPWWVRMLSAACLGVGTMIGYRRVVHTLGERVGKAHLTPGQGAAAELVGAGLIGTAGFTGLPVSTTHIITSGIAGTMIGSGAGLNRSMLLRIVAAWVLTLPVTIVLAAGLFFILGAHP